MKMSKLPTMFLSIGIGGSLVVNSIVIIDMNLSQGISHSFGTFQWYLSSWCQPFKFPSGTKICTFHILTEMFPLTGKVSALDDRLDDRWMQFSTANITLKKGNSAGVNYIVAELEQSGDSD